MAENSKISWCNATFNGWIGCSKVSAGCAKCYAEVSTPSRVLGIEWGKGKERKLTSNANWNEPIKWNRKAIADGFKDSQEFIHFFKETHGLPFKGVLISWMY